MAIKFICDQAGCGAEINQSEGGGTFTLITKVHRLNPITKEMIPELKQEEFQLCVKHAEEISNFLKKAKVEPEIKTEIKTE